MKLKDILFGVGLIGIFVPFIVSDTAFQFYDTFNREHGVIMSVIKFAILATIGEILGLRIKTGNYYREGFGIIPRAVIWGIYGITIKFAFLVFAVGTKAFLTYMGFDVPVEGSPFSAATIVVSFSISVAINLIYSPVLMTMHKITDTHIEMHKGSLMCLVTPIKMREILKNLNWQVQWDFVFKKTIPLFWIPAHVITFSLPPDSQILFAAILGVVLGVLLGLASLKSS